MTEITTKKIILAAIIAASGERVETVKQSCSPRCYFQFPSNPLTEKLVRLFETGQPIPLSQQAIWAAYRALLVETKVLQAGRIGGIL